MKWLHYWLYSLCCFSPLWLIYSWNFVPLNLFQFWMTTMWGRVFLVVRIFILLLLWTCHTSLFWSTKFLLKTQPVALWCFPICFSIVAFQILSLTFDVLITMCPVLTSLGSFCLGLSLLPETWCLFPSPGWGSFQLLFFQVSFMPPLSCSFPSGSPILILLIFILSETP